ncbi:FAD/NAD(P)-binding protein [Litoreibacter janthinus]|uniref:FAD-NAD(P)-binding n=1 Tax=Litoreibacter janthinus TaxID=670154 RepID=A0A1I6GTU1_9RHOB|nr:FAD/NAD(P)-binding protein [Litoreibacter janthinus]SFR45683.1 FAD-NAD(P)-binding [Litoreibacter janthinus]
MPFDETAHHLAVIGFGPRGLGALEALAVEASENGIRIHVDIFDPFEWPGAGPNFDPEQSDLCLLNIPIRDLEIDPDRFLAGEFGSFLDWSTRQYEEDDFPSRSDLGAYLHARFSALHRAAKDMLTITHARTLITHLDLSAEGWRLKAGNTEFGPYDEILLTQGQPKTEPDPQLKRWDKHAEKHKLHLMHAYPANRLLDAASDWAGKTVAIRGLGLSTFDVIRLLTSGLGGTFSQGRYKPSGKEPQKILPFSLNGLPPSAKPATLQIDKKFDPTLEETLFFEGALKSTLASQPEDAVKMICDALVEPTARILSECGSRETDSDVTAWLETERKDAGAQEARDATEALKHDIEMAYGRAAPSVGYVIGQIWRKWQNELRRGINSERHQKDTAAAIVGFDEGLKRYSYGPPVSASEELLILIKQGLVSLCIVDDPAVLLEPGGWRLIEFDDALFASVMIDAVLPSPNLAHVSDPLISSCKMESWATPFAPDMGAHTLPDGQLVAKDGKTRPGLCLLGRLALGSVIAADSLHDCFGASSSRWAKGVAGRLSG